MDGTHAPPVTAPRLEASVPDWSPGGRRLAFTSNFSRPQSSIYVMHADGTGNPATEHLDVDRLRPPVLPAATVNIMGRSAPCTPNRWSV